MDPEMQALSMRLAEVAVRNTAGMVADRVSSVLTNHKKDEVISQLEQLVTDLVSDKGELLRIAHAFEEEMVAQRISTEDIAYITGHLFPLVKQLIESGSPSTAGSEAQRILDVVNSLLSVETVTVLQLIGFNFRRALGEPLTSVVSAIVSSKAPPRSEETQNLQLRRDVALTNIALDPDAYDRFLAIYGRR
jgi:hypothetical protein